MEFVYCAVCMWSKKERVRYFFLMVSYFFLWGHIFNLVTTSPFCEVGDLVLRGRKNSEVGVVKRASSYCTFG